MKIFDFLREHHFKYDDINTDNFNFGRLPKNEINFNDEDIKAAIRGCYFLNEDKFLTLLTSFMNERLKTQNLSFTFQNDGKNKFLCGSDGQCIDFSEIMFAPYISENSEIGDQSFYFYLDHEIGQTWHNKTLTGIAEQTRKYLVYQELEKHHKELYRVLYNNITDRISRVLKDSKRQADIFMKEFKVDITEPFPRILPEIVYKHLAKEANDLFILNKIALRLVDATFDESFACAIHKHVNELTETNRLKKEHYMFMDPEGFAEKLAIDTELMLLKLEHCRTISTLLISYPVLETTLKEQEKNEE